MPKTLQRIFPEYCVPGGYESRAVSSVRIAILHRTSSGRQLKQKKKEMDQDRILSHSRVNGKLT